MPSRFSVPFHLWSPSATLLFGTHPPPLTPLIQPRHLLKAGTFFSPNFAPAEWMTSASRRNIKRRGAGGGRSAGKGDLLRCESAGLNPQLQPVVLGPRALPLCCFRFSWRSAWRTCSAFFFFFFSFSLESALYVTCFFFFITIILNIHYLETAGAWKPISVLILKSLQRLGGYVQAVT